MAQPIVLLTDFGTQDSFVGVMKGVIAGIAPSAAVIDLTHEIRPQDLFHASYTLAISAPYFPAGSIFCCVVDPGVGSTRRPIALRAAGCCFVAPDNGLLSGVLAAHPAEEAVTLSEPRFQRARRSDTFHGRDLFAPVAAHLAAGVALAALGEPLPLAALVRLPLPANERGHGWRRGSVQHVDRFGNVVTTLHADELGEGGPWRVTLPASARTLPRLHRSYAEVAVGEPVAYVGSDGFLELALRNGDAATAWGVRLGDRVELQRVRPA